MKPSVIVWDLETVPDLGGFAAANDLVGKSDVEVREWATLLAAPNAAASSVARYSFAAWLTCSASSSLLHCDPGKSLLVGVSNDQTGINRETFSADETGPDVGAYYMLEHTPEDVTVAEPLVARTRECRMIGDLV